MKTRLFTVNLKINENPAAAKNLAESCKEAAKMLEAQFGPNYNVCHVGKSNPGYQLFAVDVEKHLFDMLKHKTTVTAYTEGALSGILWAFGHKS